MRRSQWHFIIGFGSLVATGPVLAQELYVYPSKGQSQQQLERDRYECHRWAKQQTGYDPTRPPQTAAAPPPVEPPQGGLFRGAARGAAVGAVGGAIGGDAGKGAAIGAGAGALIGGMRRRDQRRRQDYQRQQYYEQQQAAQSRGLAEFNRAMAACLNGRGYQVR